jgi:signal recognition particle receptor subunit alpha
MSKNVAEEIAQKLYGDVQANLLKQKAVAFTSITQIVKKSLSDSITKILTPKRIINPIAEALTARQNGRPYVIAFIGVNGVGKSTNLAKVAYLFKNEGFSVMLAACDNFRAGAVEQLKTHGN